MFQCDRCHTEYGGIRGISAGSCPRCKAQAGGIDMQAGESPGSSWSPVPLLGAIAQLDRAIRAPAAAGPANLLSTAK